MAARKIPKSYRNVTGIVSSRKNHGEAQFESTLEQDFYVQLEFREDVVGFQVQPVSIEFTDSNDRKRTYTPDVLVSYSDGRKTLYEVKYSSELQEKKDELVPKFKAAITYSKNNGLFFRIATEKKIRTTQWNNIQFLKGYAPSQVDTEYLQLITSAIEKHDLTTPKSIVEHYAFDPTARGNLIYCIWQMLAKKTLKTDISIPLSMDSPLALEGR